MNGLRVAVVALAFGLQQPPAPAPSPVGLLGYWKGDDAQPGDGAADSSGQGRKGTYSPGATVSTEHKAPIQGENRGSFSLDGKTGMITIPDDPALRRSGDFTLSFWKRKTENNMDWVRIVGKGGGAPRNFGLWEYPAESGGLKYQQYTATGQSVLELDAPGMPSVNTWHHVVCTTSVNACGLYVDGKPVGFLRRSSEPGTSADPLTFGHAGYHGFFAGQIDDVRLYDRALSMSEIDYLAQGKGAPEPPTDLTGQFPLLSWKPSPTPPPAGTLTYYTVKRWDAEGKLLITILTALTTTSANLPESEKHGGRYVVTALNTGGESVPSAEFKLVR